MLQFPIVTDDDLARARADGEFRRQLVVASLQSLIELMGMLRASPDISPTLKAQLREGADLAVQLSTIVRKMAEPPAVSARAQPKSA